MLFLLPLILLRWLLLLSLLSLCCTCPGSKPQSDSPGWEVVLLLLRFARTQGCSSSPRTQLARRDKRCTQVPAQGPRQGPAQAFPACGTQLRRPSRTQHARRRGESLVASLLLSLCLSWQGRSSRAVCKDAARAQARKVTGCFSSLVAVLRAARTQLARGGRPSSRQRGALTS